MWIFDDLFFVEAGPYSSKTLLMQYEKWYKLHVWLQLTSSSRRNEKKSNKFILIILPYYKMILISLYMKWKFVVFIFILLVKVLPHSNFRGFHAFYFSLYKLSPKMVCSKKTKFSLNPCTLTWYCCIMTISQVHICSKSNVSN